MKNFMIAVLSLVSATAFASETYNCDFTISKDGETIGKIQLEQQFGAHAGRLYTLQVSKKYNMFGKTKEEVEVVLNGMLINQGNAAESSLQGEIAVVKTTYRRGQKGESSTTHQFFGNGDFNIDANLGEYVATGGCAFKE